MAFDRPPNPNAMKLFVNWALGREAQGLFIRAGETSDSLRKDVDNSVIKEQYRILPDRNYIVSFTDPDYINRKDEVMRKLRKIMEEAGYK
jgi:ABC-type Fe3+ transport system substrate-binding protein